MCDFVSDFPAAGYQEAAAALARHPAVSADRFLHDAPRFSSPPEILTARLRLRAHRPDDLAACHALWGDIDVVRHITGKPATREETWGDCCAIPDTGTCSASATGLLRTGPPVPLSARPELADYQRDIVPSLSDHAEIGWLVSPQWHGRGLASEAVGRFLPGATRISRGPVWHV
ncbi:MAG: GNAT family N-acetyltransferase [Alphaproteobacteria bacterium]|nr:GNAT family N-acetyltransferase [Alphaproteobacteria bacterium]